MAIDPYAACPGGTGKKIKFCCPDLVGELEKLQKLLDAEQRVAALELIQSLETKYPDRACLLSVKAMLHAQLGDQAKADATLSSFMDKYPDNPVALAEAATLKATQEGGAVAIAPLQQALAASDTQLAHQVYDALGVVAMALLSEGNVIAALGHLMLQIAASGGNDQRVLELLMRINASASISPLYKQQAFLSPAPPDASWRAEFDQALDKARRGAWQPAAELFAQVASKAGDASAVWKNVAILRGWLADSAGTISALRKVVRPQAPLDDAVEAEALAQLIESQAADVDPTKPGPDRVNVLTTTFTIRDIEKLISALSASPRTPRLPIDLARMGSEEAPPPRAAFLLLDRALPTTVKGLDRQQVPQVVGQMFLFGRQTDREARLEVVVYQPDLERMRTALSEVAGDSVDANAKDEVTTTVDAQQFALSFNWRLPDDTTPADQQSLMAAERQQRIMQVWPDTPLERLGGRSPRAAAGDPQYQVPILAMILLLESSSASAGGQFDYNELRRALNLPESGPIDPAQSSVEQLTLVRLARVDVKKLSDADLIETYYRASEYRVLEAMRTAGLELLERPNLAGQFDRAEVYGSLAQISTDSRQAIEYVDQARKAAEAAGNSSAPWDLTELALQIATGDMQAADRLLRHLQNEHINEPGIAQGLFQILVDAGIVRPDGTPVAAARAAAEPGIVVPGGGEADAGKIWTPGSDQPSGGKKSALWTPGD